MADVARLFGSNTGEKQNGAHRCAPFAWVEPTAFSSEACPKISLGLGSRVGTGSREENDQTKIKGSF
jgi:hypothetical protein